MWKQACGLFTLVVFFSKSQWRCSIPCLSFSSDVSSMIWCLCQNLHQQRTIIVNLANVYKVQHLAAGLCSLRICRSSDYAFSLFFCLCFMCLRVMRGCVWRAFRVAERSSGCHRGAPLCEAGASLINVCWCRRLHRCEGMRGLCCYLLLCLCTAANPRPANGITVRDEWALG